MGRILVTVSRGWPDRQGMGRVLAAVWSLVPGSMLVSGANPDGDVMAEGFWESFGGLVERHRAKWRDPCREECEPGHRQPQRGGGTYCPAAGHYRNEHMALLGALLCVGFIGPCRKPQHRHQPVHPSHGATDMADMAEYRFGIVTRRYPPAPILTM